MSRADGVAPTTWCVVLSDWFNAKATVTITMKSGAAFTGKVDGHPTRWLHDMAGLVVIAGGEERERHNIDLTEVAAITARAR